MAYLLVYTPVVVSYVCVDRSPKHQAASDQAASKADP